MISSGSASRSRVAPGRSCMACQRRKIRCNRHRPCAYCTKFTLQCIYPDSGTNPAPNPENVSRQPPKNNTDNDVLTRLDRIEKVLTSLALPEQPGVGVNITSSTPQDANTSTEAAAVLEESTLDKSPDSGSDNRDDRLLLEDGDARYVTNTFWSDIDRDEHDNNDATDSTPCSVPMTHRSSSPNVPVELANPGFLFGVTTTKKDLRQLHPSESLIFSTWQLYLENVDPVVKLIHVPTVQRQVLWASRNLAAIPPVFETLMFAIYFATVTSIQCADTCRDLLREEREVLLSRYKLAVEQSLARARFMSVPDVPTLQALTLYLICARQSTDKDFIWSMTGLLVRQATKLGLHRDPAALGLPPFQCEIRRRLWWQIVILDVRVAEDNDTDPCINEHDFDTVFPTNVSDFDLHPNMEQAPAVSNHRSEMLFTLCRFEISYAARKLVFSPRFNASNGYPSLSLEGKSALVESVEKSLDQKYLRHCDTNIPICNLAASAAKMVLAKIKLTIHQPSRNETSRLTQGRLGELAETSIDILEYAQNLRSNDELGRWMWLFQTYIEWNAAAFLLLAVAAVPMSVLLERARKVIDAFFGHWRSRIVEGERRWRRLLDLRARAASHLQLLDIDIAAHSGAVSSAADVAMAAGASAICTAPDAASSLMPSVDFMYPVTASCAAVDPIPTTCDDGRLSFTAPASQGQPGWDFDAAIYTREASNWEHYFAGFRP